MSFSVGRPPAPAGKIISLGSTFSAKRLPLISRCKFFFQERGFFRQISRKTCMSGIRHYLAFLKLLKRWYFSHVEEIKQLDLRRFYLYSREWLMLKLPIGCEF